MSPRPTRCSTSSATSPPLWPVDVPAGARPASSSATASTIQAWLAALDAGVKLSNIRTGCARRPRRASRPTSRSTTPCPATPTAGRSCFAAMPDVEFRLLGRRRRESKLFASASTTPAFPRWCSRACRSRSGCRWDWSSRIPGPADHPSGIDQSRPSASSPPGSLDDLKVTYAAATRPRSSSTSAFT